jgi:hypothetical protein
MELDNLCMKLNCITNFCVNLYPQSVYWLYIINGGEHPEKRDKLLVRHAIYVRHNNLVFRICALLLNNFSNFFLFVHGATSNLLALCHVDITRASP